MTCGMLHRLTREGVIPVSPTQVRNLQAETGVSTASRVGGADGRDIDAGVASLRFLPHGQHGQGPPNGACLALVGNDKQMCRTAEFLGTR
jgi:hypothetical protein